MSPSRRRAASPVGAPHHGARLGVPPPARAAAPHRPWGLPTTVRGWASRLPRTPLATPPPSRATAHLLEHTRILHHDGDTGDLEDRVDGERVPYNFLNL